MKYMYEKNNIMQLHNLLNEHDWSFKSITEYLFNTICDIC